MSDRGVRSEKKSMAKILLEHGYAACERCRRNMAAMARPDALKSRIIAEEFRAKIPGGISGQGINMLVPTLLELGTEEQKRNISNRH